MCWRCASTTAGVPRSCATSLGELRPDIELPAASTIGDWLARRDLTVKRRRRPRCAPYSQPFAAADQAQRGVDGGLQGLVPHRRRGALRSADIERCDEPLSCLCQEVPVQIMRNVRPVFDEAFASSACVGDPLRTTDRPLPRRRRAGCRPVVCGGSSLLSGRSDRAGQAEQNGRHERMHRTLKHDTAKPPRQALAEQQARSTASAGSTTVTAATKPWLPVIRRRFTGLRHGPTPALAQPDYGGTQGAAGPLQRRDQVAWGLDLRQPGAGRANLSGSNRPPVATGACATPMSNSASSHQSVAGSAAGRCITDWRWACGQRERLRCLSSQAPAGLHTEQPDLIASI